MAGIIAFLLSPAARDVNGTTLPVDQVGLLSYARCRCGVCYVKVCLPAKHPNNCLCLIRHVQVALLDRFVMACACWVQGYAAGASGLM